MLDDRIQALRQMLPRIQEASLFRQMSRAWAAGKARTRIPRQRSFSSDRRLPNQAICAMSPSRLDRGRLGQRPATDDGVARHPRLRIWAEQSPFDLKDELKKRGYRWNDGVDGRRRSWYIDVDEASHANEIEFLRTTIYLRDVEPRIQAMSAINRFSNRA